MADTAGIIYQSDNIEWVCFGAVFYSRDTQYLIKPFHTSEDLKLSKVIRNVSA